MNYTTGLSSTPGNNTAGQSYLDLIPFRFLVTTFLVVDGIIVAPIIFGNLLILVSIIRFHRLRTRINLLIANLAVSDLLLGAVFLPYDIVFLTHLEYTENKLFCLTRHALLNVLLGASTMNLFAISLERYMAIIHPLKHPQKCEKSVMIGVISGCWIAPIIVGILPLLGWNNWKHGIPCDIESIFPKPYRSLLFIYFASSLIANFIMYVKVMKTAWKQMKAIELKDINTEQGARHFSSRKRDLKKTKMMILLLGAFAICWGPFIIAVLVDIFFLENENVTSITVRKFLSVFGQFNSGLNWIIFGFKNKDYRRAFKYIVKCGIGETEGSLAASSGST